MSRNMRSGGKSTNAKHIKPDDRELRDDEMDDDEVLPTTVDPLEKLRAAKLAAQKVQTNGVFSSDPVLSLRLKILQLKSLKRYVNGLLEDCEDEVEFLEDHPQLREPPPNEEESEVEEGHEQHPRDV